MPDTGSLVYLVLDVSHPHGWQCQRVGVAVVFGESVCFAIQFREPEPEPQCECVAISERQPKRLAVCVGITIKQRKSEC